jgi:hypothetical protein
MLMKLCQSPTTAIEVRSGQLPEQAPRLQLGSAISLAAGKDLRAQVEEIAASRDASAIPRRLSDRDFEAADRRN